MNEQSIFLAALDIADPGERAAYLSRACDGNPLRRRQVESLLAAHERSGEFLDVPALAQIAADSPQERRSPDGTVGGHEGLKSEVDLSFLQPSSKPGSLGRLEHYEVEEVIGRGGCGIVLKAFDEKLRRIVAIKVIAPELAATSPARKRFLREARAAAAIRHENVISIHSVEDHPIPFLVMEYIAGQTLQDSLDQTGPLDVREVLQIGLHIARGLEAAHALGLIHRDIKPANILLEDDRDCIKITDFGLARTADDASVTQSGMIAGTPLYMSPEQALGQAVDPRSDLFSLGSVLYVMCSGRPPFRASTTLAILKRVAEEQPRPIQEIIPEAPDWLVAIIAKLHAKKPDDRFASAQEVADLLGHCLAELQQHGQVKSLTGLLPVDQEPRSASPEPQSATSKEHAAPANRLWSSRRWLAAAGAILALLAGLTLTEASGVTNVRGTVIHMFSSDGTLVVEVDDPGVSVTIDGEEMVITGAGAKELRLKPGQYQVLASKDGKLLRQELVTVTQNGRQVVRVSREQGTAPSSEQTAPSDGVLPSRYTNSLGMEFVLVPRGKAWLGGGAGKPGDKEVEFQDDFYLGVYEVTQEEWGKLIADNLSYFGRERDKDKGDIADVSDEDLKRFPVDTVSWHDAQLFLKELNARELGNGWSYRLPTEAEWEYACRGGPSSDKTHSSFDFYLERSSTQLLPKHANVGDAQKRTCKVGSYPPNRLGLYDMHGNVCEWCDDEFPPVVKDSKLDAPRILRGGCWSLASSFARASDRRMIHSASFRHNDRGLRVARVRVDTADLFQPDSVWTGEHTVEIYWGKPDGVTFPARLIVIERSGEHFKARFEGFVTIRTVTGAIRNGVLHWSKKDVQAEKGNIGFDHAGKVTNQTMELTYDGRESDGTQTKGRLRLRLERQGAAIPPPSSTMLEPRRE